MLSFLKLRKDELLLYFGWMYKPCKMMMCEQDLFAIFTNSWFGPRAGSRIPRGISQKFPYGQLTHGQNQACLCEKLWGESLIYCVCPICHLYVSQSYRIVSWSWVCNTKSWCKKDLIDDRIYEVLYCIKHCTCDTICVDSVSQNNVINSFIVLDLFVMLALFFRHQCSVADDKLWCR